MNIALTYFCNQDCPYCFAKDVMSSAAKNPGSREMSMDNLDKAIDFLRRSGLNEFKMIGGEPTLHRKFEKVYDRVSGSGLAVSLFSNGVMDKKKADFLSSKSNLRNILLNIRQPEEYTSADWKKLLYLLSMVGDKITLSFRIYKMDFDVGFIFDLIDKYKLMKMVNWAIACPSLLSRSASLSLDKYPLAVGRMVEVSRISKSRGISWYSDSGFMLCIFSQKQLDELKQNTGFIPDTNCQPAVEVAPDLRVFRCYGMAGKTRQGLKITDFKDAGQAFEYFLVRSRPFKRVGCFDKCLTCEHSLSGRCGGGCMVHILKNIPGYRKIPSIF